MTIVGLGCARLGSPGAGSSQGHAERLVHAALDLGVTYFDTADAYSAGESERMLGRALRGRPGVTIATKGGFLFSERSAFERRVRRVAVGGLRLTRCLPHRDRSTSGWSVPRRAYREQDFSAAHLTTALEASLRRLRVDHVDVYQLHAPSVIDQDEVSAWAQGMIDAGKLSALGVGAENVPQASLALDLPIASAVLLPFGILDPKAGEHFIARAARAGISVAARGVLAAGLLAPNVTVGGANIHKAPLVNAVQSIAAAHHIDLIDVAVGYVSRRADVDIVVVGTGDPIHLARVVESADHPPTERTLWAAIDAAVEKMSRLWNADRCQ